MKLIAKAFVVMCCAMVTMAAKAQTDARSLITQGIQLSSAGNYSAAADKFTAALAVDSTNLTAKYQMGYALNAMGKGTSALPYLQQVVKGQQTPAILSSSYALMADIYERSGQPKPAIENYKLALKIDTASYALKYGLGLAYFRNHQYAEAEKAAIAAMNTDATQAASIRLYGLVTFHQNKRAPALFSLCYFLWLQPNGSHSQEAVSNIQSILQGGTLKPEPGVKVQLATDADTYVLNQAITKATNIVAKSSYSLPAERLAAQLQAVFARAGALAQKQRSNPFFSAHFASLLYKLSQTTYMPAFARTISSSADKTATVWLNTHQEQTTALKQFMLMQSF